MFEQAVFEFPFIVSLRQRQEIEVVRVAEQLSGEVAFRLRQRGVKIVDRLAFPQVRAGFDLVGEDGS